MFDRINILKQKGYSPDLMLDIGAHHGNWTYSMLQIYSNCEYKLFEAIDYTELNRYNNIPNITRYNAVLNNKIEEIPWYEMRNTGDSMFKEKTYHFDNCNIITKTTNTLNNLLVIPESIKNIFIKIDCQGAEIPILQGASNLLNKTDFILLEIPLFGQYNENVPSFLEHIKYMDSIGFIPYDITDNHYINNFNMQLDVIFINKLHPFNIVVNELLMKK